jgi:hypothetical protein
MNDWAHHTARRAWLVGAAVGAALAAGCFHPYGKVTEFQSPTVPGSRFHTLSVIAGESDHSTIQIAARVRDSLQASKVVNVVNRSGRWVDEAGALKGICPDPSDTTAVTDSSRAAVASDTTGTLASMAPVDGVVIVWWNRVSLRDCRSQVVAYDATGAAEIGVDGLTRQLIRYLKTDGRH